MNLAYQAMDASGRLVSNRLDADTVKQAVEQLRQKGLMVTEIQPVTEGSARRDSAATGDSGRGVKLPIRQQLLFTRQMAMLLSSGSAMVPALHAIGRQAKRDDMRQMLKTMTNDLESGSTLTESMQKWPRTFDPSYCAVVAAGEASASLPKMFDRLSQIIGARRTMHNKVLGALMYPLLLCMLCGGVVNVLLFFVLPRFGEMFKSLDVPLPWMTKLLLALGTWFKSYWPVVLSAVVGVVLIVCFLVMSRAGRRWCADMQTRIPIVGKVMSKLIQGQILRTLGMLFEAKVGILESLDLARTTTGNDQYQKLFDQLDNAVTSGGSLSDALERSKLVDPAICQAVRTGEESGNLGGAVSYAADVLDEDNAELVSTAMRLLEPCIVILMGIIVGVVAVSLFMPMFDMTSLVYQQ